MKNPKLTFAFIVVFGTLFAISCKTQKKSTTEDACGSPAPGYSSSIKSIVENKCAIEGCHARGRGDFRVFENFKRKLDAGEVKEKVIVQKSMPPDGALPAYEIKLIECWLKDGAKEN